MAAYPTLPMRTRVTPLNDRKTDVSEAGYVRQVDLSAQQVYRIDVRHEYLTDSELSTLLTSWSTNKGTTITITAGDGYTYDCLWTQEPRLEVLNGTWQHADVTLIGKRN